VSYSEDQDIQNLLAKIHSGEGSVREFEYVWLVRSGLEPARKLDT
jgi:hypothetical protein